MSNSAKVAGAMGGKAARACDGCLRRRARWYCAADDAFLCQGCDTSVHSANPLARRHERLRLRPPSPLLAPQPPAAAAAAAKREEVVPAWFKRKARTPRPHVKSAGQALSRRVAVPEVAVESSEERKAEEEAEEEEQLLYRVPIFDPALAEFCSPPPLDEAAAASSCCKGDDAVENPKPVVAQLPSMQYFPDRLANFGPTDAELTEFAADMEALIGRGLDDSNVEDSFYMETLGLIDSAEDRSRVKVESDGAASDPNGAFPCGLELEHEASAEMLDIDFDCGSPRAAEDEGVDEKAVSNCSANARFLQRSLALRLDYEAIIESWGSSPWTDGERPYVNLDDNWPHDYLGVWMAGGKGEEVGTPRLGMDGGREARVTRYREKRRTRLFSKKIRYEVRKLNAEKRPRMKGRFVKRTNTGVAPAVSCLA